MSGIKIIVGPGQRTSPGSAGSELFEIVENLVRQPVLRADKQQVAEEVAEYEAIAGMPPDEVVKLAKRIEREMSKAARDLQFERAALLRDQLIGLRKSMTDTREAAAAAAAEPVGAAGGRRPARAGGRWRRGR